MLAHEVLNILSSCQSIHETDAYIQFIQQSIHKEQSGSTSKLFQFCASALIKMQPIFDNNIICDNIMSNLIYSAHFASAYYSVLDLLPLFSKFSLVGPVQSVPPAARRKVVHNWTHKASGSCSYLCIPKCPFPLMKGYICHQNHSTFHRTSSYRDSRASGWEYYQESVVVDWNTKRLIVLILAKVSDECFH